MSNSIRKWIFVLLVPVVILVVLGSVSAPSHGVALRSANIDINDTDSLQRGVKYYVNYCMGCHSLNFSRYNRVAKDIGLNEANDFTQEDVKTLLHENLIFTRDDVGKKVKVGSLMKTAFTEKDANVAFGGIPDLSVVARARGSDWIYSYLHGFYLDDSRPMGVNNTIFKDVGMPHVLWELQGWQVMEKAHADDAHGDTGHNAAPTLKVAKPGKLSKSEYDKVVRDITNFISYVGEPVQMSRKMYGVFTLLFLVLFFVVALALEKEYWKDIH